MAVLLTSIAVFAADSPGILVRTRLEPASVSISQAATLHVEVYTDAFFTSGISLPPLTIPGAIVKLSDERPLHLNTTVKEASWTGIEHKYTITPIVAADLDIPAFEVSAHAGPASTPVTATTQPVKLQVSAPADAGDAFITHDLQITQKTDADLTALKVGDSFSRTVELTATGTPAMFIPDVDFGEIDGLKAYPATPALLDSAPDQPLVGKRTFTVNYVVQRAGDYELPAVSIPWWNLQSKQLGQASVPALQVHAIAAPPPPAPFALPQDEPQVQPAKALDWRRIGVVVSVAIAALLLAWWLAPHVSRGVRQLSRRHSERRARHLASEPYAYRQLQAKLRKRDDDDVPAALYRWLDRVAPSSPEAATTTAFAGDAQLLAACEELLAARYGTNVGATDGTLSRLRHRLPAARRDLLRTPDPRRGKTHSLPPMNPL